jgi:outer membrane protein OmpA-like peptidoglycan-associated protein
MEDRPMRPRLAHLVVLALVLAFPATGVLAADATPGGERHWYFSPYVGWHQFDSHYGQHLHHDPSLAPKDALNFGGRITHVFGNGLGYELAGGWTSTELQQDPGDTKVGDLSFFFGSLDLLVMPDAGRWGRPFLAAGGGAGRLSYSSLAAGMRPVWVSAKADKDTSDTFNQMYFDVAAGWMFRLSDRLGLRLEARNLLWLPHKVASWSDANHNDVFYGAALTFGTGGKPRDTDGDGVPDRKDKCPSTPTGARVDATGCPTDADGDGVFDGLDQCPDTPKGATVDAKGCPTDADGDGVFDGLDQCPDTPKGATVDAKGCPSDADGDGVFDGLDQCPGTPTGAVVDAKGCPVDSDGDGVADGLDKCPNTPAGAKVDTDGCPVELIERETELLDTGMIRLENVQFETAKADILPESHAALDIVGQLLAKWPQLKIEIGGHTDSRGNDKYNQKLSEQRAQSVEDYLVSNFKLDPGQFTVKGYGESKPLVPNTSAANMARNRRVEFVVQNKDVLKKERETRKLQQK